MEEIRNDPHTPPAPEVEVDARPVADREKCLDVRSLNTKKRLLRQIFDAFAKDGIARRAKMLVAFGEDPSLLLRAFPRHASDLPAALEKANAPSGDFTWKLFCNTGLLCLSQPGSAPE